MTIETLLVLYGISTYAEPWRTQFLRMKKALSSVDRSTDVFIVTGRSNARTRIAGFRLSEDEYSLLQQACTRQGARNVSEFTRSTVLTSLRRDPLATILEAWFARVETKLAQLEQAIVNLYQPKDRGDDCVDTCRR